MIQTAPGAQSAKGVYKVRLPINSGYDSTGCGCGQNADMTPLEFVLATGGWGALALGIIFSVLFLLANPGTEVSMWLWIKRRYPIDADS